MIRGTWTLVCGVLTVGIVAPSAFAQTSTANVDKKIANFSLTDSAGKSISLHDFKDKKAIAIVFLSFDCPVSNSYCKPLADMAVQFGKYGVAFLGVTVNDEDTPAKVAKLAKEYALPFPVVPDPKLHAADALKAEVTPEVFLLDSNFVLRYRGRIDNGYYARLKHKPVTENNLQQALGELLSGRPLSVKATEAIGCSIARPEKRPVTGDVTFYRDVLPILQNNCQTCHRPGEVGPFSLMTYRQAVNWADDIKTFTHNRHMPPWKPTEGPSFYNERKMSERDIAILAKWVDSGTPAGDKSDAPPPRKFPEGWMLGTPDLILTPSEEFTLGATGRDLFRCFVMPTNLPEGVYVTAVEVRPSNPRIVHHALLFVDAGGEGRKLEQKARESKDETDADHPDGKKYDIGPGYTVAMGVGFIPQGGLSGWAPGNMPRFLPEGTGYYLPKGADVVMQVHFHRNGRVEKERPKIGLYFAKKPVAHRYQGGIMAGTNGAQGIFRLLFTIPAGDENFKLTGEAWATGDFKLHSIMPHMHLLGKQIKVTMTPPDGKQTTLIAIKEWDYNWQESYFFKEPIDVKAGTHFQVEAIYDNSSKNPNNPFNPPRRITYGEQTTNEMCFVFFGGYADRGRRLPLAPNRPKADPKTTAR